MHGPLNVKFIIAVLQCFVPFHPVLIFTSGLFNGSVIAIYCTAFSGIMISEY
jgi:hypothetical protein